MSNSIKRAWQEALDAARNPVQHQAVEKTSAPKEPSRQEKLSAIKERNESLMHRGQALVELGRRGFHKIAMTPTPSNTWYADGTSSRDFLLKHAHVPLYPTTEENHPSLAVAYSMGVTGPDDAVEIFTNTARSRGVKVAHLLENVLELHIRPKAAAMRQVGYLEKNSSDIDNDISKAKDAVQAIVKAKGELPDAVDIADAANVSPIAANIAVHETAELIAAVGGQVAASDIPDIPPEVMGPEEMGAGMMDPMMDPGMTGPPPMDPNMMGPPPMDPGMMDPNMMGPPPMDPGMMDPNMMPPEEGMGMDPGMMEAQAGVSDDALRRIIAKVAADAEEPSDEGLVSRETNPEQPSSPLGEAGVLRNSNPSQPSSNLEDIKPITDKELKSGAGPTSSSDSGSPSKDSVGDIKIHGKDARSTQREGTDVFGVSLEQADSSFLSAQVDPKDVQGTMEGRLKEASVRGMLNQLLKVSEEGEGEEQTSAADPSEIKAYIREHLRSNSSAPSVATLQKKFDLSEEDAEEYLEAITEIIGASEATEPADTEDDEDTDRDSKIAHRITSRAFHAN